MHTCERCDRQFEPKHHKYARFCSRACANARRLAKPLWGILPRPCQQCDRVFKPHHRGQPGLFCSRKCAGLGKTKVVPVRQCVHCGRDFQRPGKQRFCSAVCASRWRGIQHRTRLEGPPAWKQRHREFSRDYKTSMSVTQLEQAVPALPPVEVLRRNLLYAMFQAVGEDDMTAVVSRQVEKAKEGDTRSARLVIELVQAGTTAPSPTHMQQAIVVTGQEKEIRYLSDTRRNLVHLLSSTGPLTTVEIARAMHLKLNDAAGSLDHDWFVKSQHRWHLTEQARAEVLLQS